MMTQRSVKLAMALDEAGGIEFRVYNIGRMIELNMKDENQVSRS